MSVRSKKLSHRINELWLKYRLFTNVCENNLNSFETKPSFSVNSLYTFGNRNDLKQMLFYVK